MILEGPYPFKRFHASQIRPFLIRYCPRIAQTAALILSASVGTPGMTDSQRPGLHRFRRSWR